jgi:DNA-binding response OmpR family regulator
VLRDEGFDVDAYASMHDLLEHAPSDYSLALVGVDSDEHTAESLADKVRERFATLMPVLLLTMLAPDRAQQLAGHCGAVVFIDKPIHLTRLLATIRTVLARRTNA